MSSASPPLLISDNQVRENVSFRAAIEALGRAFDTEDWHPTARSRHSTPDGELLVMPAVVGRTAGVKLVTVTPHNPSRGLPLIGGIYVLFAADTMECLAIIAAGALTAIRTAAASALATDILAAQDAARLVIFGSGVQAHAHLAALRCVRPIRWVRVLSRNEATARRLVAEAQGDGLDAQLGGPTDLEAAQIVCTCTTATSPLFDGRLLRAGTHVNAVGAHRPIDREVDDVVCKRSLIVVEQRDAALAEAGDLVIPMGRGVIRQMHVAMDLFELRRQMSQVSHRDRDLTLYKSVGIAFADLVIARLVYEHCCDIQGGNIGER